MDESDWRLVRDQIAASRQPVGLSFDEAMETTTFSQSLVDQYTGAEEGNCGVAALRIDAFLSAPHNRPFERHELLSIAAALREKIANREARFSDSDLRIAIALFYEDAFSADDVESVVIAVKQSRKVCVASQASRLLPIIGTDFIQDLLVSEELSETGGMGGPIRPLVRQMATRALREFRSGS